MPEKQILPVWTGFRRISYYGGEMMKKDKKTVPPVGINGIGLIPTDPLGSYTGVAEDPFEKPIQDADDL